MIQIKPPDPLDLMKADTRWPDWKRRFERYRISPKLFKEEDIQVSTLLYTMGAESEYVFTQFGLTEDEAKHYTLVVGKFDGHFRPERNVIHERAMFHERSQHSGESAELYIRSLYEMAEHCDFGTAKDDCIHDRLVVRVRDLKEKLTLAESVKMVRQSEIIQDQLAIQNETGKTPNFGSHKWKLSSL